MKLSYYAYCLRNMDTGERIRYDLTSFIKAFTQFNNIKFKSRFTHDGENLYLLHNVGDTYLFLMTRSQEIIKKIDTSDLSVSEIHTLLKSNEQLGFASYVLFKNNYFGFASTLLAPRIDAFSTFMNDLFESVGIKRWEFVPQVLLHKATKAEVLAMNHIGATTIELAKNNTVVQQFLNHLSVNVADTIDLRGMEITIKPVLRKNIKPTIEKVINNIEDAGIEKMVVKAKKEAAGQLQELFLISSGAIADNIDKSREERIPELLESKCESNDLVKERLQEYLEDEYLGKGSIDAIEHFSDVESWANRF